jgi:predicted Zn-dependent protease
LRDSEDPRRLDEAESYLLALWQRSPQDAAVNLALARVAAHRGSIEDATRYYHNAMYGVWNIDPDSNRNRSRIELIEFLLSKNVRAQADSELIALAASLPANFAAHLQAAQLFIQAQNYAAALGQYAVALRVDPASAAAMAGAGEAAYRSGNYTVAQRYLRAAVSSNPADESSRQILASTDLVLASNPFQSHISDAERNRRISAAFAQSEERLTQCARQTGVDLAAASSSSSSLSNLQSRWITVKPYLNHLRFAAETDLPDAIMDVVFQIEQQTAVSCGPPQGFDLALLLISEKREGTGQ